MDYPPLHQAAKRRMTPHLFGGAVRNVRRHVASPTAKVMANACELFTRRVARPSYLNRLRAGVPLLLVALCCVAGCVERTLTINTTPEGALVYVNDVEVGRTPVSTNFTWYGDYDIIIRKDGYKSLKTSAMIREPWYQVPPIDFFAECLTPATIRDQHYLEYELEPADPVAPDELVRRAEEVKERTLYSDE